MRGVFVVVAACAMACRTQETVAVSTVATTAADAGTLQRSAALQEEKRVAVAAEKEAPACVPYEGPRSFRKTIERPEGKRAFEVRMPSPTSKWPAPIVVAMHPFGGSAVGFLKSTKLDEEANRRGYVTISPEGYIQSFNGGDCCGYAKMRSVDDASFVLAAVDEVAKLACVRADHVNFAGFSNGGFMSQAMACKHADRTGSIVSVGGSLGLSDCEPARPISILLVNGSGDPVIPMRGGGPYSTKSLEKTLEVWRAKNQCDASTRSKPRAGLGAKCEREACGEGTVLESCVVPYAHAWTVRGHPDGSPAAISRTAREVMDFIAEHEKP